MTALRNSWKPSTDTGWANSGESHLTGASRDEGIIGYPFVKAIHGVALPDDSESVVPGTPPGSFASLRLRKRFGVGRRAGDKVAVQGRLVHGKHSYEMVNTPPLLPGRPKPVPARRPGDEEPAISQTLKATPAYMQHRRFLDRVTSGEHPLISLETASQAEKVWVAIWLAASGQIPPPAACTGPDGEMFYSWDRGRHHLEIEIIPDEPAEFFYRDRETERVWGEDYVVGEPLPAEVINALSLFK